MKISAVVLAAGLSSRMGQPKMLMPWKGTTFIQTVARTLLDCGLEDIVVVTGAHHERIEILLDAFAVKVIINPNYENGEMLCSFQEGLRHIGISADAVLLMLGDQPQIQVDTITQLIDSFHGQAVLIPSYKMRRGHPWIIHRSIWTDVLSLAPPSTLRDLLRKYSNQIFYVDVDTPTILQDIDTPEDYQKIISAQK